MTEQSVLKVDGINVFYGDLQAIWDVSIDVRKGQIVSIIGANGAGKSTLLNSIAGVMTPRTGTIEHKGVTINGLRPDETVAAKIALVPEGRRIFSRLSVYDYLIMGSYPKNARADRNRNLERVYHLFPKLAERRKQRADTFRGGEQQMLAIGRALMSGPEVMLCDEISLGLAPKIIKQIYKRLEEINDEGMSIVLVEQDIHQSLKEADYVYVMLKGKIVLEGEPSTLNIKQVKAAYFGL
ncbi:MAG: ABC transporter ATP-binding protein [Spirochaetales bacterium]|nr:ABC transporter ATP-binding protein [Spirochaetales bacterium]